MLTAEQVEAVAAAVAAKLEPRLAKLEAAIGARSGDGSKAKGVLSGVLDAAETDEATGDGSKAAMLDDGWNDVLQNDEQVGSLLKDLRNTASRLGDRRSSCARQRTTVGTRSNARDSRRSSFGDDSWRNSSGRFIVRQLSQDALTRARELAKRRAEEKRSWLSILCPVLHPEGRVRKSWNPLVVLLICFCAVAVPLEMGYERGMRSALGAHGWHAWIQFSLFVDLSFLCDIILNFRTGFMVEGEVVSNAGRIARHYVRSTFLLDLVGAFPINIMVDLASDGDSGSGTSRLNRQLRLLRFFKLNRLLRLSKLSAYLKYLELETEFNPAVLRVVKLVVLMVACCHWMGSAWWLVSEFELAAEGGNGLVVDLLQHNLWHPSEGLLSAPLGAQVASGIFWGAGIVTNMIPRDIEATTEAEFYVTAFCMFVGLLLNAFIIGSMASALNAMDSKKQICRGKLETIGLYLLVNNVAQDLRARILEYYEYLYTSSQSFSDLNLLRDLPPSLGTRLAITAHRRLIARAPFLSSLSDTALLCVLKQLQPLIYVPSQVIQIEGQRLRQINFIKKGRVQLLHDLGAAAEIEVRMLGINDNFGLDVKAVRTLEAAMKRALADPQQASSNQSSTRVEDLRDEQGSVGAEEATVGKHVRLGLLSPRHEDASAAGDSGADGLSAEPSLFQCSPSLTRFHAPHSARAITYCDVVSLGMHELLVILDKDIVMQRKLSDIAKAQSARNAKNSRGASPGACAAVRWIGKLRNRANASEAGAREGTNASSQPPTRRPPTLSPSARVEPFHSPEGKAKTEEEM